MRILITGSSGHLGEALVRTMRSANHDVVGIDLIASDFTNRVGSIADRDHVRRCITGIDVVIHAATLHKPHVATHSPEQFVETNITGTLNLLEESVASKVKSFIFTSTTSVFARTIPQLPDSPAAWITEDINPIPKNIYGVTKLAAENLCDLFHHRYYLPCIVLRTSRFFPEEDDRKEVREAYSDTNIKVNEFLYRRVDIEDVASAHLLAIEKAPKIGFSRYIISATTPFVRDDLAELRSNAPTVLRKRIPEFEPLYARLGWRMFPGIDRVYVNERARMELGWRPRSDFRSILQRLAANEKPFSPLAYVVGSKGYHPVKFTDGPFPVAKEP
jgi:nucleoside-diphosphate-sugar epimerase